MSNNSENWGRQTPNHSKIINFFYALRDKIGKPVNVFCNIAKYKKEIIVGADNDNVSNVCKISSNGVNFLIDFTLSTFPTASDFYDFISKNPIIIYYLLETPIETDLTPDQLAALDLSTYQGITNIGTDTMPQAGMAVESRGFNLAGDLAQNLIDLQTTVQTQTKEIEALQSTVQNQGSAIAENTEKLNTLGLVGYGRKAASQSGESVSLISLISEGASIFKSGAIYSVYFDVTFSDYGGGDATFQPYIQSSISDGQIHITKIDLPPVYQASSVSMIPYSCTFMIPIDEDEKVTGLSFYVDENSHNFKDMTVAVYRVK